MGGAVRQQLELQVGLLGRHRRVVHFLAQRLEHLVTVVGEVALDLGDAAILHHPQHTLGLTNQPLVVSYDHHTACELVQRFGQSIVGLQVEIVGRLKSDRKRASG